jgi:hypothetical protein
LTRAWAMVRRTVFIALRPPESATRRPLERRADLC